MSDESKEKLLSDLMESLHGLIDYWTNIESESTKGRLEGLTHSILCLIDGVTDNFPPLDLSLNGVVLNDDIYLHDLLYNKG